MVASPWGKPKKRKPRKLPTAKPKKAKAKTPTRPKKKARRAADCAKPPTRGGKRSKIIYRDEGDSCGADRGETGWKKRRKEAQKELWKSNRVPTNWPRAYVPQPRPFKHATGIPVKLDMADSIKLERAWSKIPPPKRPYRRQFNPRTTEIPVHAQEEVQPIWDPGYEEVYKNKKALAEYEANKQKVLVYKTDAHHDPDLRWFVDPEVAGEQAGKILVMFSGGKDSLALLLYVIDVCLTLGLNPSEHVEAWHQSVDGRPEHLGGESSVSRGDPDDYRRAKWDWPVTESYCQAVCDCLEIPLYFGWREGGLQGNVLRGERRAAPRPPAQFELPEVEPVRARVKGRLKVVGYEPTGRRMEGSAGGKSGGQVRMSYPMKGANLKTRWCSSEAKIDVAESQIAARLDLRGKRILYCSGERAEESANRATYAEREFYGALDIEKRRIRGLHGGTRARHVEKWRPVLDWCELDVWAIIRRWGMVPHPAYTLGFGRLSCITCLFGNKDQWASIKKLDPKRVTQFGATEKRLQDRKEADTKKGVKGAGKRIAVLVKGATIPALAAAGKPYKGDWRAKSTAMSKHYNGKVRVPPSQWKLPAGAFGEDTGPT
jgi:3'-phosphoadenosine 5'-phosphosulfate sulfotransferase (PAPS reductase)/FAD synthetase